MAFVFEVFYCFVRTSCVSALFQKHFSIYGCMFQKRLKFLNYFRCLVHCRSRYSKHIALEYDHFNGRIWRRFITTTPVKMTVRKVSKFLNKYCRNTREIFWKPLANIQLLSVLCSFFFLALVICLTRLNTL